jgi:hypothetical protein
MDDWFLGHSPVFSIHNDFISYIALFPCYFIAVNVLIYLSQLLQLLERPPFLPHQMAGISQPLQVM